MLKWSVVIGRASAQAGASWRRKGWSVIKGTSVPRAETRFNGMASQSGQQRLFHVALCICSLYNRAA